MTKPKFDLSNVGGQPKDWMQREHEKEVGSNGWDNFWVPAAFILIPLLLLLSGGAAIYGLFKIFGKIAKALVS